MAWLDADVLPPEEYLSSAVVNLPLIGVVQLAYFWVMWKCLGKSLQVCPS